MRMPSDTLLAITEWLEQSAGRLARNNIAVDRRNMTANVEARDLDLHGLAEYIEARTAR